MFKHRKHLHHVEHGGILSIEKFLVALFPAEPPKPRYTSQLPIKFSPLLYNERSLFARLLGENL